MTPEELAIYKAGEAKPARVIRDLRAAIDDIRHQESLRLEPDFMDRDLLERSLALIEMRVELHAAIERMVRVGLQYGHTEEAARALQDAFAKWEKK